MYVLYRGKVMADKIIIDNRTDYDMTEVLSCVSSIVSQGRISGMSDDCYCYCTVWDKGDEELVIFSSKNKKSDRFVVVTHKKRDD
jgi:hypothetical protein